MCVVTVKIQFDILVLVSIQSYSLSAQSLCSFVRSGPLLLKSSGSAPLVYLM